MSRTNRIIASLSLIGIWFSILFMPAANTDREKWSGFDLLAFGWIGPLALQFGWYANILFFIISWSIYIGKSCNFDLMRGLSIVQVLLVINTFFWTWVADDSGTQPVTGYGIGYWAWMLLMAFSAMWAIIIEPRLPLDENESV